MGNGESFCGQIRAYFVVPVICNYTFLLASDGGDELYLDTDIGPTSKWWITSVNKLDNALRRVQSDLPQGGLAGGSGRSCPLRDSAG